MCAWSFHLLFSWSYGDFLICSFFYWPVKRWDLHTGSSVWNLAKTEKRWRRRLTHGSKTSRPAALTESGRWVRRPWDPRVNGTVVCVLGEMGWRLWIKREKGQGGRGKACRWVGRRRGGRIRSERDEAEGCTTTGHISQDKYQKEGSVALSSLFFSAPLLPLVAGWGHCHTHMLSPFRCLLSVGAGLRQHQRAERETLQDQEAGQRRLLHHLPHSVQHPAAPRQPLPQWVFMHTQTFSPLSLQPLWRTDLVLPPQSTPTDCVTVWRTFVPYWSLRLRVWQRMPGRSPESLCIWTSSSGRAVSERSGWVRPVRLYFFKQTVEMENLWRNYVHKSI